MTDPIPAILLGLKPHGALGALPDGRRVRRAILALYAFFSFFLVAALAKLLLDDRQSHLEGARARTLSLARAYERQMAGIFSTATQYLVTSRAVVEDSGGLDRMTPSRVQALRETQVATEGIRPAVFADAHGMLRAPRGAAATKDLSQRAWYRYVRDNHSRSVAIGLPVRSFIDQRWVIPFAVRIDRDNRGFDGALAAGIDVAQLLSSFKAIEAEGGISIALVRDDGLLLLREPGYEQAPEDPSAPAHLALLRGAEGTSTFSWSPESALRVTSFRKVPGYPLYVVVGIPHDEVLSAAYRDGGWRIARAASALLIFTLFIALLLRRIRREETIAAGLQHFRRAVETCADLAFWVSRSGRFIYANQAACERLGYSHEALAGRSVNDISPEFDQARWDRFWQDLEQHGQVRFSTEVRTASGESLPIGIAASRVLMAGEPYVFSIGRDLSDERANRAAIEALNATLEKRVRERTDELRAANEELEAFTSSVSHDLRAPVRAIEGFADLLVAEAGTRLDGKAGHLLLRLRAAASRMNALIDGLLTLSRASRVSLHSLPVDLGALAREIVAELAAQSPERRYETVIADGLTCRGDPVLLRQVMENLIGNAWKYSSTQWCTRIEVGAIVNDSGQREFFIRDNGVGFDAAYADKLFHPFERLHSESEFPGAGVGLATVRRIISRHGGSIRGRGAPGQGAAFHFTLGDAAA